MLTSIRATAPKPVAQDGGCLTVWPEPEALLSQRGPASGPASLADPCPATEAGEWAQRSLEPPALALQGAR